MLMLTSLPTQQTSRSGFHSIKMATADTMTSHTEGQRPLEQQIPFGASASSRIRGIPRIVYNQSVTGNISSRSLMGLLCIDNGMRKKSTDILCDPAHVGTDNSFEF